MRTETFFGIGAAFAALMMAMPAAAKITQINSPITVKARIGWTITVNYGGFVEEQRIPGLKAQTIYTLQSVSHDKKTWIFDMTSIKNLSVAPVTSRVSIFGFDIDDDTDPNNGSGITLLKTSSTSSDIFSAVSLNSKVPQVGLVDICFTAKKNCTGGGGDGVSVGDVAPKITPTFTLQLHDAANSLTFNNFFVRYQSITKVDKGTSGVGLVETVSFVDPLPEPGTWLQMIAGFGLIGVLLRRQRRAHAA